MSKKKEYGCDNFCRFCGIESGAKAESVFHCPSIELTLIQCKSCLNVCRSSGRKIRNAAELYCVIKTAVTSSNAITARATNCKAVAEQKPVF